MNEIRTRVLVGPDHRISGIAPADVPPGEHEVILELLPPVTRQKATRAFNVANLPMIDLGAWPDGVSLRREDLYGDDGR